MSATVAVYQDILKEVWTSSRLVQQFLDQNELVKAIKKTDRFTVGDKAKVPIHKGRSGGYSVKGAAGGALNGADNQKLDDCDFDFTYHYFEIEIENATIQKTAGKPNAIASALETEVTRGSDDLKNQVLRQILGDGTALIANCTTTTNSTTVNLSTTGFGFDAISRGFLYPGLKIDIGTTANEVLRADGVTIVDVHESASDPEIVLGAAITTDGSDYVSIKDARSGTTSLETNGLLQYAGSTTAAFGSLDPDTAGESFWQPANVDSTTTTLSLDKIYENQRKVHQKTGKPPSHILTSLIQQENAYKQLEMKVRYAGDRDLGTGNVDEVRIGRSKLWALPEVYDRHMHFLTLDDLFTVSMADPDWMSNVEGGSGGRLRWKQGYTSFVDAAFWYFNLGAQRRNSSASMTALTA